MNFCGTSEAMKAYYKANPNAKKEQEAREAFTAEFVKNLATKPENNNVTQAVAKYRIPVVFHVYGNNFWGKTLTDAQIVSALAERPFLPVLPHSPPEPGQSFWLKDDEQDQHQPHRQRPQIRKDQRRVGLAQRTLYQPERFGQQGHERRA